MKVSSLVKPAWIAWFRETDAMLGAMALATRWSPSWHPP
jgi:hypothetical protein